MSQRFPRWIVAGVLALFSAGAWAAACSSLGSGNWNTNGTWSCGATPGAGDDVTINNTHNVNLNGANRNALSLTINTGGTLTTGSNSITIPAGTGVLTVNGTILGNGNAASLVTKNSTGNFSGTGSINNVRTVTINDDTTVPAGASLTFTGARCALALGTNDTVTNNGTITFDPASCGTSDDITLTASSVVTNNGSVTVDTVTGASGAIWTNAANSTLDVSGVMLTTAGTVLNASANPNTITYSGAAQTVKLPSVVAGAATYWNLTLSGSGAKTMPGTAMKISNDFITSGTISATAAQALTVGGAFTIGAGTTFNGATFTHNVSGNFSNNGTFTATTSTMNFTGTLAQTLGGTVATTFNNLTINKATNDVTMGAATPSPTVNGTLTLTAGAGAGNLIMASCAANPIILGTAGVPAGGSATSYVQGPIQKNFTAGAGRTLNFVAAAGANEFPVGTASSYAPIEITTGTVTAGVGGGSLLVCVTAGDDTNMTQANGGGIDTTQSVNLFWSMTNTNLTAVTTLMDATFKFNAGDVDGGATTGSFIVERWNGSTWSPTTLNTASATSTRAQNINLTVGTNEFEIGEPFASFPSGIGNFNAFDQTNATTPPAATVLDNIQTKQSGVAFTVRIVRITNNAVVAGYNTANVPVHLFSITDNAAAYVAGTACRSTWPIPPATGTGATLIASTTASFAAGVATATFTVPNSYKDVRVHVNDAGTRGCSTDNFAIRPTSIAATGFDATWQTAGTGRALANTGTSGGIVHAAAESTGTARPFTLRATPAPVTATNYDGSPTIVSGFPTLFSAPMTANGVLSFTAGSWTAAGSGIRENATASYSEAGVFNLQLEDQAYASVDANDGSSAATRTVPASATVQIGRFVPDHFTFSGANVPQFQTFNVPDTSCQAPPSGPKRSFTYIGQPFWYLAASLPTATVHALNANGNPTTNYQGTLFHLTTAMIGEVYADAAGAAVPNVVPTAGAGLTLVGGSGIGTYTADVSGKLTYTRSTTAAIPASNNPFTANLSLTVTATDSSESSGVVGNPGNSATPVLTSSPSLVFSSIAFDSGALFRFGIMKLGNALGSQSLDLPMPLQAQYWAGTGFTVNTADNCTSISLANVSFPTYYPAAPTAFSAAMPAGNVSGTGTFKAGAGDLTVKKPSVNTVSGAVDVQIDLAAETKTWLQLNRNAGTFTQNPLGRAAFGLYGSQPGNYIYFRENY